MSLSDNGNEICFCTIGDASTSEGHFWEVMNAAGVMQVPLAVFVWDDGYGISVPKEFQTTKSSISKALSGLQKNEDTNGINIYNLKGWDYAGMCEVLEAAIKSIRETHTPALFHVEEITQPQGHSTSGSHERYKTPERLAWETEWECRKQMREWIIENALADDNELRDIEIAAKKFVKQARQNAWEKYITPIKNQVNEVISLLQSEMDTLQIKEGLQELIAELSANQEPLRRDVMKTLSAALRLSGSLPVKKYYDELVKENSKIFNSNLYNEGPKSALKSCCC